MAALLDLYNLRRKVAQKRQASQTKQYTQLHDFLTSLARTQAYDLSFGTRLKFEALPFYVNDAFGRQAVIPNRDSFIYRICSMKDIVSGTEWRNNEGSDTPNWNQVYRKSRGKWMPLSRVARGVYGCRPRRFSWWTSFPLFDDIITGGHRIGLTNNWVPIEAVVLRCPVDHVNKNKLAFVPSVIDAFMQMIFHPTKEALSPPYGITIDLSFYPDTLTPGTDEIVLREIPVSELEVLPVYADDEYRKGKHTVPSDCPIFASLLEYYYKNL